MKHIKRIALRVFFALEITGFAGSYLFGEHGLPALRALSKEIVELERDISVLSGEINDLDGAIVRQADPFYKEKIAREQLQMARKGDQIFIIGS